MERVGFVGLGTMGRAMAANLARAGFPLTVWNRTPGRAGPLIELGATEAASPAELGRRSEVVVVCVSDTPDVEAAHAALRKAGVDVDAESSRMGDPAPPVAWVRDPGGTR